MIIKYLEFILCINYTDCEKEKIFIYKLLEKIVHGELDNLEIKNYIKLLDKLGYDKFCEFVRVQRSEKI